MTNQPPPPAAAFDPHIFPQADRTPWQLILDHNPCFLLSTVLMLVGCFLLNSALDVHAGDTGKLFGLLAAINVYEAAIIFLGLVLIRRRRGVARDGLWLLLFETLLLVDGTFLIAETVEANTAWGWAINLVLLILAVGKGAAVLAGMRIRLSARTIGFLALQLIIIYSLPVVLKNIAPAGVVSARAMYVAWWIVGILPVAYDLLARAESPLPALDTPQQVVRRTYLIAPWLLAIAHLAFFHYTYHADFYPADLAPVILGLAAATLRVNPGKFLGKSDLMVLRVFLPLVALGLSIMRGDEVAWWSDALQINLRPEFVTLIAAVILGAYFISRWTAVLAGCGLLTLAGLYFLRAWLLAGLRWGGDTSTRLATNAKSILPSSVTSWGILAIGSAFALLALGAWLSLRKTLPRETS